MLDFAPCGFLTLTESGVILAMNATLLALLAYERHELDGHHIDTLLPLAGRVFFHTYLFPLVAMHGKAEEIFLNLRSKQGAQVPVLTNAVRHERQGQAVYDCVFMPMHQRSQYEDEILRAKKAAEEAIRLKDQANRTLEELRVTLEAKQAELLEANTRLETLVSIDGLTQLKNRRAFETQLDFQIALATEIASPLSLLLLDIDHFKRINDTFGHPVGDHYLRTLAEILQQNSRETDFAARYGGEEFAMILPNTDPLEALAVAERLRKAVETAAWAHTPVTVSIGAATFAPALQQKVAFVAAADQALYQSKANGRNRVTFANAASFSHANDA